MAVRRDPVGRQKLDQYQKIKQKYMGNIKNNQLNQQSIQRYYKKHRCDGCNSLLQSEDKEKYGFIRKEVLEQAIGKNVKLIQANYGVKVSNNDDKTMTMIQEVEKDLNIKIFDNRSKKLNNLDNVEVLLRLQEKIDKHEEEQQTIRRTKKQRQEIFCYRCYSLKYHNKLPDEYDKPQAFPQNNQQIILNKVFSKHKNIPTLFLFMVDVLDIAGTFQKYIFDRLLLQKVQFAIVINKLDIVNQKYLNKHLILQQVRNLMLQFMKDRTKQQQHQMQQKIDMKRVFMVSSISKSGIDNIQQYIQKQRVKRIQLLGFPNTGKTTLLNELTRMNKPTSKVPGTTLYITQNYYKKNVMYDMPGLYSQKNMYNLINKPNLKSLLAWNKFYSPTIMLHQAFFFGGKVQSYGVKIILFGLGGACASDNKWFMLNYKQFWKGLPPLHQLKITKYEFDLSFEKGKAQDLQIFGWGFIGFRLAIPSHKTQTRKLTLYLPKGIQFHFRDSVLKDSEVLTFKSVVHKRQGLQRIQIEKKQQKMKQISKLNSKTLS